MKNAIMLAFALMLASTSTQAGVIQLDCRGDETGDYIVVIAGESGSVEWTAFGLDPLRVTVKKTDRKYRLESGKFWTEIDRYNSKFCLSWENDIADDCGYCSPRRQAF